MKLQTWTPYVLLTKKTSSKICNKKQMQVYPSDFFLLFQSAYILISKLANIILKVKTFKNKTSTFFLPSLRTHLTMRVSLLPQVQPPSWHVDQWQPCEAWVDFARLLFLFSSRDLHVSLQWFQWYCRSYASCLPTLVGSNKHNDNVHDDNRNLKTIHSLPLHYSWFCNRVLRVCLMWVQLTGKLHLHAFDKAYKIHFVFIWETGQPD